jgi:Mor family transcriptional regulator
MASRNATAILPERLIKEIQKYVQGETLYIPKTKSSYKKWGTCTGSRKLIDERNQLIKQSFQKGRTIAQLSNEHFLSIDSIKKIVYSR